MSVEFDFGKLRGRIIEKFSTCSAFADEIGWKSSYLSAKLKGKVKFTITDIQLFCEKLDIDANDIGVYFFCLKSLEN